ncbi:MAG: hypothetical protein IJJ85_11355 [Clostridia bacterium]|nr:hypothetical protein [Clostridia bacterium]
MYIGNGRQVGAHWDCGHPESGDQGGEVTVQNYYNNGWTAIFRYGGGPVPHNPTGVLDGCVGGEGTFSISGWAFDEDDYNHSVVIHVYIGGPAGVGEGHGGIIANQGREDVNNVYHCGVYHGFGATISTDLRGEQPIYVYAIDGVGGGTNL